MKYLAWQAKKEEITINLSDALKNGEQANILLTGTPAAIYIRYCTHKQSKETQLQLGKDLVQSYGLKLVKVYTDETSSYSTPLNKRRGISELLSDASKGLFKVVITMTGDRLTRNPIDMIAIRKVLDFNKIHLVYSMSGTIQPSKKDIILKMGYNHGTI